MKIGKWIKAQLKEYGYTFSVNDTVGFVNWKLAQNNEWIYVSMSDFGLAIFDKSERGA